jgi:hypothetical protein
VEVEHAWPGAGSDPGGVEVLVQRADTRDAPEHIAPLTIEQRIDRARDAFKSRREFYVNTYPRRYVGVGVDTTGRTTVAVSQPEASWVDAYNEFKARLPPDGGCFRLDVAPGRAIA